MSIAVNVLDCLHGRVAVGVAVRLVREDGRCWIDDAAGRTDENGRVTAWKPEFVVHRGVYRAELNLDAYFTAFGITPFVPTAIVSFRVLHEEGAYNVFLSVTPASCAAAISS